MQSAIKAKLIELGTGSSSGGYIDDELPDYVMIMVANKRSIQQMTDDLSLFLGSNTNVFVLWLHQVLEKLQEVTLPANPVTVQPKKRKTSTSEISTRNEKKDKKKKTKNRERTPDLPPPAIESPNQTVPSITDVFAEQFIQKAKETIELEQNVTKKTKVQRDKTPPLVINNKRSDNKYVTPFSTESVIKSAVEAHLHSKEIQELKELQEKIYQTKQQLKTMCSSDDEHQLNLETDDDFLNIRATEDDIENVTGAIVSMEEKRSTRIPIIYNENSITLSSTKSRPRSDDSSKKKSVLDRLGTRNESYKNSAEASVTSTNSPKSKNIISLAAHRREERELYTPHYRRLPISSSEKEISYAPSRIVATKTNSENSARKQNIKPTNYREREKTPEQRRDIRNRMGSRCVVIPPSSSESNTYEESEIEVPVNSVVKIKPRPFIPPNKQANKYLLLRAVADAQKSTSAVKASLATVAGKKKYQNEKLPLLEKKNILTQTIQNTKVQNRNNTFYIEVKNTDAIDDNSMYADEVEEDEGVDVVEEILDDYMEQTDFTEEDHLETDAHDHEMIPVEQDAIAEEDEKKTQFVVTLNIRRHDDDDDDKKSPVKVKRSIKDRIGIRNKDTETVSAPAVKPKISTADSTTEIKKKTKIIINRNNTESIKRKSPYDRESNKIDEVKKSKVSPINFNLTDDEAKSSHDGDTEQLDDEEIRRKLLQDIKNKKNKGKSSNSKPQKSTNDSHRNNIADKPESIPQKKIKKLESSRKFDNVPEVLSSISIPALESAIVSTGKSKMTKIDRCKFFPFCNQGESCDFMHPTVNCKLFPNCKFGNNCNYIHPKCKFDKTCFRSDCNFAHSIKLPQSLPNTSASASPSTSTASSLPPLGRV